VKLSPNNTQLPLLARTARHVSKPSDLGACRTLGVTDQHLDSLIQRPPTTITYTHPRRPHLRRLERRLSLGNWYWL